MNYSEFVAKLKEELQEYLKKYLGEEVKVTYYQVKRNNDISRDCFIVSGESRHVSPAIYLEAYYAAYQEGTGIAQIVEDMSRLYQDCCSNEPADMEKFTDFEYMKDRIFCCLVNKSRNRELLEDMPHFSYLDLAVIFYFLLEDSKLGTGMIRISHEHLRLWGVEKEEICRIAKENTKSRLACSLLGMDEIIRDNPAGDRLPMYVLTNSRRYFGACEILFDSVLAQAAEKIGGSFYVLPSSVHECVLIPETDAADPGELAEMVRRINQTQVLPEEVLSDRIYHYDAKNHHLTM